MRPVFTSVVFLLILTPSLSSLAEETEKPSSSFKDQVAEAEISTDGSNYRILFQNRAGYFRVDSKNKAVADCLLNSAKNLKDIELEVDRDSKAIQGCKRVPQKN